MEQTLLFGLFAGFFLGSTLVWGVLILRALVPVPPGRFLAIVRSNSADPAAGPLGFVRSGRAFVMPFFQRGCLYPAEFPGVACEGLSITREGVAVLECSLTIRAKLRPEPAYLNRFVGTLGGLDREEIAGVVLTIAGNGARQLVGQWPAEQVLAEPEEVVERLREQLEPELGSLGLSVGDLTLQCRRVHAAAPVPDASEFSLDRVLENSPFGE